MEVPAGQRNQYLVDVILEKEERETLRKLIQETVREELKSGGMERMPACEKEEMSTQPLPPESVSGCICHLLEECF